MRPEVAARQGLSEPLRAAAEVAPANGLDKALVKDAAAGARARPSWVTSARRLVGGVALADAMVMAASLVLGWPARELVPHAPPATADGMLLALHLAPGLWVLWLLCMVLFGAYNRSALGAGLEEFRNVGRATVTAAFASGTVMYFTELPLSRGYLVSTFVVGVLLLFLERYAVRKWLHRRRLQGSMTRRVLVVGTVAAVRELSRVLAREKYLGYEVVVCTLTGAASPPDVPLPALQSGSLHEVGATCLQFDIDTVMLAGGADSHLRDIAWSLEGTKIDLVVVPHLADVSATRMQMRPVGGLPLLHVEEPQAAQAGNWPKRVFDMVGAAAMLVLLSPLMLTVAALVKVSDGGSVFYRQWRVGLHGELFRCWKFRSMCIDADAIEAELRSQYGSDVPVWKLKHDPRVTRVGRFIRRFSIDELPQLFNVLAGSMSLVGPRPQQQWEVDTYTEIARRRLHVRPGMTGLWQVSGRNNLNWDETLRLDLYYRDNWSMFTDFLIMAKTVRAVLGRDGVL